MKFPFRNSVPGKFNLILIHHQPDGDRFSYACITSHSSVEDLNSFGSMEEILKKANKKIPFILHIRGIGVLARSVENVPNYKERLLVSGREDEFYFNSYERSGSVIVSFARKSLLDEYLEPLKAGKSFIWGIYAGPAVLPFKTEKSKEIRADYVISFPSEDQVSLAKNDREVPEKQLQAEYLDAIRNHSFEAAGTKDIFYQGISEEELKQTKSNYKDFFQFKVLGLSILSFFLLALTINYFIVNHLNQIAVDYEQEIAGYQNNFAVIDRIKQEKQRKLVLFQNSGIQSGSLLSYYTDEIGTTVPPDILFTRLDLFPLAQQLKPKHKVETDNSKIVIEGITANSKILDDWMEDLEKKEWVQSVEVMNYSRLDDHHSTFRIIIHIRK